MLFMIQPKTYVVTTSSAITNRVNRGGQWNRKCGIQHCPKRFREFLY
jgi:hypothetical protein